MSVGIEANVIPQPGWQHGLRRFWHAVSHHLSPFYTEVRRLGGYHKMGGTYGTDMETDVHPIRSWFWRGIPRQLGQGMALGPPYTDLWPDAYEEGETEGDLVFFDVGDWASGEALKLRVPEAMLQRWTPRWQPLAGGVGMAVNWVTEYPEVWPFDRSPQTTDVIRE